MSFFEMGLTMKVWKKKWKRFALLPLGLASTLAFHMGIMIPLGRRISRKPRALSPSLCYCQHCRPDHDVES